jgi:hypothetical protein
MRFLAALAFAALTLAGVAAPAGAGLLELPFDQVSLDRHCDAMPCRSNNLHRLHTYVRDRYLRYDVHTRPARYALRRVRVMIEPPGITVSEHDRWSWLRGERDLVAYPTGPYRVVKPAQYMWVTENVLVSPARNYVTRRHPHYAYYPQDIYVSQP